jgi:SPP1 gp7 family putative phage head morphogenesis protein
MSEPIDLAYAVTLAPKDAIEYFQAKGYEISWNWWEVWREQHAQAFTVAKAMKLDVLQTLRDAVGEALAEGQTQEQFARLLTPKLKALGWWGWQEHIDTSTGEITRVKLGSPWRLKTIYRTNLQSAYMAGRWKAQAENADAQPYLQYVAVMDAKTRPGHAALNGKVFRIDDPVWNRIYPPNGFNCRCRTRALSQAQLDARQLQVSEAAPVSREMEIGVDKRTGEIIRKDVGGVRFRHLGKEMEFYPDAGFDYNPGAAKWGGPDLRQYEADLAAQYRAEAAPKPSVTDWKALGLPPAKALRVMEGVSGAPPALLEGADTVDGALDVLREALGVQAGGRRTITTPVGEVVIDDAWLRHIVEKREAARERYANWIVPALEQPTEVWLSPYGEGENRKRFIKLFAEGGKDMLVVVSLSKNDVVWNAIPMPTRSMDNQRNGELLWSSYR